MPRGATRGPASRGSGSILVRVLQELCPRCGAEVSDPARACPVCGFDPGGPADRPGGGMFLGRKALALLALGTVAMLIIAFGAGLRFQSFPAGVDAVASPAASQPTAVVLPERGHVLFAERLGESLELESYRTQFTRDDTIAWRAEFVEPPGRGELTLVITWVSIRERMQLREVTVAIADDELRMVASDEVPVGDLVPTAGMYEVAYYFDDIPLAVGVFELLPPTR